MTARKLRCALCKLLLLFMAAFLTAGCVTEEAPPTEAEAYIKRGLTYVSKGQHDVAIADFNKAQGLGFQIRPEFLKALRKASGREIEEG